MSQTNQQSGGFLSSLYRTRVKIVKGDIVIINLSLLFMLISLLLAPWLVILGIVAALIMGYRFTFDRNDPHFNASLQDVMQQATSQVKSAVDNFTQQPESTDANDPQA